MSGLALLGASPRYVARALGQSQPRSQAPRFGLEEVVRRANDLARMPFLDAAPALPHEIDRLDYDLWRDIRFKPDRAIPLSAAKDFRLETFHLGFLYPRPIKVNVIHDGIVSPLLYSPNFFDYGRVKINRQLPADLGFAGLRVNYPLNDPHVQDEVISFLGASYFRFLGRDQRYGLSARGLCVEAGTEKESFPFFREFWLEAPQRGSCQLVAYALLDSAAATGAFRFDLTPGQETTIDVQATLFPRQAGVKFGLAPLTSMFLTGENDHRVRDGFRSELHDSDGLQIQTGEGEWIWRPLANPPGIRTTSFIDRSCKGFGLMQRDRAFDSYQDLELAYERRPSYFVEPMGDWGPGRVELIELPTSDETNDNIVASWTPATPPEPLKPFSYAYRLTACLDLPRLSPNGRVVNTFSPPPHALGSAESVSTNTRRFLVDFSSSDLAYFLADPSKVEAVASATNGQSVRASVAENPHIGGLRAMIDVTVKPGATSDIRLFLRNGSQTLTETWTFPSTAPAQAVESLRKNAASLEASTPNASPASLTIKN